MDAWETPREGEAERVMRTQVEEPQGSPAKHQSPGKGLGGGTSPETPASGASIRG